MTSEHDWTVLKVPEHPLTSGSVVGRADCGSVAHGFPVIVQRTQYTTSRGRVADKHAQAVTAGPHFRLICRPVFDVRQGRDEKNPSARSVREGSLEVLSQLEVRTLLTPARAAQRLFATAPWRSSTVAAIPTTPARSFDTTAIFGINLMQRNQGRTLRLKNAPAAASSTAR